MHNIFVVEVSLAWAALAYQYLRDAGYVFAFAYPDNGPHSETNYRIG